MHYILRKATSTAAAVGLLSDLAQLVEIVPVDAATVRQALAAGFPDFEDALQYFAATSVPALEALITRDLKGFQAGTLPILTSAEAVAQLR
ncbi:MAG: hypothetical protein H7Z21_00695 [Hymenobacter sp.]|nr:hypothetical protein [Hymenobacter sp.]